MTLPFLLVILVSSVLPAAHGNLPTALPTALTLASQEKTDCTVELWNGLVIVGDPIDEDSDSLILRSDQVNIYRIDKLDIRSIFHQGLDKTSKYLERRQISQSAVRAIYSGYKQEIGRNSIGVYDSTQKVTLYLSNDDVRRGKVVHMDQSSLTLKTWFGEAHIPRKNVTKARQGLTDVSVTILTEEQLIRLVSNVEEPHKVIKGAAKGGVSVALFYVGVAFLLNWFFNLIFGDFPPIGA